VVAAALVKYEYVPIELASVTETRVKSTHKLQVAGGSTMFNIGLAIVLTDTGSDVEQPGFESRM
jgi:hypothetical protein